MEISDLALRVLLLFFPGVVAGLIVDALTNHRQRTPFVFATNAFVLGIVSYLMLAFLRSLWNWIIPGFFRGQRAPDLIFFQALTDEKVTLGWVEITLAVGVASVVALILSAVINHKWLHRIARRAYVSRRSGELDTWSLLFNSGEIGWINIRDFSRDLVYEGWVDAFSDTSEAPEVLLRDVGVYRNMSGELLYRTPRAYVKLRPDDVVIEYPPV
jgi:hypothetical protein